MSCVESQITPPPPLPPVGYSITSYLQLQFLLEKEVFESPGPFTPMPPTCQVALVTDLGAKVCCIQGQMAPVFYQCWPTSAGRLGHCWPAHPWQRTGGRKKFAWVLF